MTKFECLVDMTETLALHKMGSSRTSGKKPDMDVILDAARRLAPVLGISNMTGVNGEVVQAADEVYARLWFTPQVDEDD